MALVKKISAKTIIGNVKALAKSMEDGDVKDLFNCYGRASGFKTDTSDFGVWTALTGNFEAVDLRTGEEIQAPLIFLVEPLLGMILAQLANSESVDFACMISIVARDELPTGYEYKVTPLTEIKRTDELEALRQIAGRPTLTLAAPVVEPVAPTKAKK